MNLLQRVLLAPLVVLLTLVIWAVFTCSLVCAMVQAAGKTISLWRN